MSPSRVDEAGPQPVPHAHVLVSIRPLGVGGNVLRLRAIAGQFATTIAVPFLGSSQSELADELAGLLVRTKLVLGGSDRPRSQPIPPTHPAPVPEDQVGITGNIVRFGRVPSKPRKLWSRERILQELRDGYQRGLRARKAFDRRLVEAARLRFGNWPQALSAAGLPLPKRRRWTAQAVLDALKARHQQGLPMGRIWKEDSGLCCAMKSHFGGMSAALKILGLSLNRRTWTRQDVLARLRSHLESGAPPSAVWRDRKLTAAATAHFGGRVAAWRAVGVEIEIPPKWTKASILETLRSRYQQGLPMTTRSHPLNSAARRLFGSWSEALEAAGIRIKGCWCRQRVLAELQSASDEGRSRGPYLHAAARRYFGSMKAALAAAGLDPDERKWSRELVIEAIQDRHVQGLSLSSGRCREGGLAPAARRYFGGWRSALAAAGIKREPTS